MCFGVLLALATDGPCNIGIDNASCVRTCTQLWHIARHIQRDADGHSRQVLLNRRDRCKGALRKPWGLQANGDMHLLIFKFLLAKSPTAVCFTKVKGHAKQEHIDNEDAPRPKLSGTPSPPDCRTKARNNSLNRS